MADSFLSPDGDKAFFFGIPPNRTLPPGTLLGVYFGPDTAIPTTTTAQRRKLDKQFLEDWAADDYVLAYAPSLYAVKGHERCGPARANGGFVSLNSILTYSRLDKRMEVRTLGPISGGPEGAAYECLINYDIPHQSPSYWDPNRLSLLPPAARQQCLAYYSTCKQRKQTPVPHVA